MYNAIIDIGKLTLKIGLQEEATECLHDKTCSLIVFCKRFAHSFTASMNWDVLYRVFMFIDVLVL